MKKTMQVLHHHFAMCTALLFSKLILNCLFVIFGVGRDVLCTPYLLGTNLHPVQYFRSPGYICMQQFKIAQFGPLIMDLVFQALLNILQTLVPLFGVHVCLEVLVILRCLK